jgi:hypothetical protein
MSTSKKSYENIVKKYPLLFKHSKSSMEPFALFGFECGIGWYHIIDKACATLYTTYKNANWRLEYVEHDLKDFKGYVKRIQSFQPDTTEEELLAKLQKSKTELTQELEEAKNNLPLVVQVKEKFATLRFYIDNGNEVSQRIADYAEHMSSVTCEECGNVGLHYTIGWHKTLCPEHAIKRYGEKTVSEFLAQEHELNDEKFDKTF